MEQDVATTIAQAYLDGLSAGPGDQLRACLGRPVEELVMGEDQRPYLVTVVAVRRPSGGLYLHVGVSSGDWDRSVPVIRSAVVLESQPDR
jgi:hypothetical protein